jgi:hypothetical protein
VEDATLTDIDLYGLDVTKHKRVEETKVGELNVKLDETTQFMVTFEPDPEVLTPGKDAQAFLLVRYTLGAA